MKLPAFLTSVDSLIAAAAVPLLATVVDPKEMTDLINLVHSGTPDPVLMLIRAILIGVAGRVLYMINPSNPKAIAPEVPYATPAPAPVAPAPVLVAQPALPARPAVVVEEKADSVYERVMTSATNASDLK